MIKSCHDWFPCCHDSSGWIHLAAALSSNLVTLYFILFFSFLCVLLYLFWSLLCSHSSSGIFKSSWLHCRWSTSVLAWADVGISTAAERNIKNVQPLSGRSIGKMLAEHSVVFFFSGYDRFFIYFFCADLCPLVVIAHLERTLEAVLFIKAKIIRTKSFIESTLW